MSSTKQYLIGTTLLLVAVRLALLFFRVAARPPSPSVAPMPRNAEEISERETRKAEQRARIAELLEASVLDMEDRAKLDEARGDAARALRDLASTANSAGATKVGFEALELERGLAVDARRTCSLDALKKLDAASSALSADARAPLAERLAITHRHVKRTCELAMQ